MGPGPDAVAKALAAGAAQNDDSKIRKLARYLVNDSIPAQAVKSVWSGLTLPGDVYAGKADPYDIGRALDFAGMLTLGAGAVPAGENEMRMGSYFRRSQGAASPDNGAGYSMFVADDPNLVEGYGKNLWHLNSDDIPPQSIVDAQSPEFRKGAYKALRLENVDRDTARSLVGEAAPEHIVNSAGMWDDPQSVQSVWDRYLSKKGALGVTTPDGFILFDPSYAKAIKEGTGI